jgi:IclR family pca regulon transcriptional regulator
VPKIIGLSVTIGTRVPAVATSMGRVLLADLDGDELDSALAAPSTSGIIPRVEPSRTEIDSALAEVRERGWAMSDEQLSLGIRSIAAPVRGGTDRVVAALNVTTHAAETPVDVLLGEHLPKLLATAAAIGDEWSNLERLPIADG